MVADVTNGTDGGLPIEPDTGGATDRMLLATGGCGRGRPVATDDELDAGQLTTMDSLWHARRDDGVSDEEAAQVEQLVRSGELGSARYRLGVARRHARERADRERE